MQAAMRFMESLLIAAHAAGLSRAGSGSWSIAGNAYSIKVTGLRKACGMSAGSRFWRRLTAPPGPKQAEKPR